MELKEWYIKAPWGNIALASYGNPSGEPVLLVHGRLDSVATFIPLLKRLPKRFNYVLLDMPGNGKSDPFAKGVMMSRFLGVVAVEVVIKHLGWKKFTYVGHSLGAEHGLYYASIFPQQIKKAVYIDFGPAVRFCQPMEMPLFFRETYEAYYDNLDKYGSDRVYSREQALRAVLNARDLDEEEAELVLSRSLVEVGENAYTLTWDRRYKIAPGFNTFPPEFYLELFSQHPIPTLFVCANGMRELSYWPSSLAAKLLARLTAKYPDVSVLWVDGGHDVHLTNPERLSEQLVTFLETDYVASKL